MLTASAPAMAAPPADALSLDTQGFASDNPYAARRSHLAAHPRTANPVIVPPPAVEAAPEPAMPAREPLRVYIPNPDSVNGAQASIGTRASVAVLDRQLAGSAPAIATVHFQPLPAPLLQPVAETPPQPAPAPRILVSSVPALRIEQPQPLPLTHPYTPYAAAPQAPQSGWHDAINTVASPIQQALSALGETIDDTATALAALPQHALSDTPATPPPTPVQTAAAPTARPELLAATPEPVVVIKKETVNLIDGTHATEPARIADVSELAALTPAAGNIAAPIAQPAPVPTPLLAAPAAVPIAPAPVVVVAAPAPVVVAPAAPPPLIAAIPPATPAGEPVATLAPATKKTLEAMPSNLDQPKDSSMRKISVSGSDYDKNKTSTDSEPSTNLEPPKDIQVALAKPGLDVNYELQHAYDALMQGQTEIAIIHYNNVLKNEPGNQQALFGLAATYHRVGQLEKARPLYAQLLKINPNHRDGLNNFLALAADEAPQDALTELQALGQRNPDFSPIPAQMATIYQKLGNPEEAINQMMRAVSMAPENMTYRYNLAILLDKTGRYDEAASLYRQLIEAGLRGETLPGKTQQLQERLTFISSNRS